MPHEIPSSAVKKYKVFLASPGDVNSERNSAEEIINDFNEQVGRQQNVEFELLRWEKDAIPYFHPDGAQGGVDAQMNIKECAVFIGIFWKRLGTVTKDGKTGTEHEFWIAHDHWRNTGTPFIMLFRSDAPIGAPKDFTMQDMEQNRRLNDFLNHPNINTQFVTPYDGVTGFEKTFRRWFFMIAQEILTGKISKPTPIEHQDDKKMLENLHLSKTGWIPVTYNSLKQYYVELPENEAIAFFDGRDPSWSESISPSIARREIVTQVKNEIARNDITYPYIVLLRGLGGEGKSTILQQSIYEALAENQNLYALWHELTNTPITIEIIEELAKTKYEWIVASDDAHHLEKNLREIVTQMRSRNIRNIRFLLATKDLDWKKIEADDYGWGRKAHFNQIDNLELTKEDAKRIVAKWSAYGDKGLGKLKDSNSPEEALFSRAQTEKQSHNSLLGAMLQVRTGKTLQEHLRPGLGDLENKKVDDKISLQEAIAYISALHAYNIKLVTREILEKVLDCSEEVVANKIIKPLGKEIIAGKYILIRHASIAEAYKEILSEEYDFFLITRNLLNVATKLFLQKEISSAENYEWTKLPRTIFFEKDDRPMGIELAKEEIEAYKDKNGKLDPYTITKLAYLYEKSNQLPEAVKLYRENFGKLNRPTRAYYYEWAVAEGKSRHDCLSIWLASISIADGIHEKERGEKNQEQIYISLSGLSESLKFAFKKTRKPEFLNACYASAKLGLKSHPDEKAKRNLENNKKFSEQEGAQSSSNDVNTLFEGLKLAWQSRQEDLKDINKYGDFPEIIHLPEKLTFKTIENKFKTKS
ncbi:MAG: hypothetical protein JNK81_06460 [Anaerolineales bacterium]|nr:hypothetical protein [Anaerolineales bacterium]